MSNFADERRYALQMMRAVRQAQADGIRVDGAMKCRDEIITLLDQALDAGLDRAELIVELANIGARFFALCDVDSREAIDLVVEDAEICLN
jgi:glycerol kinase